MRESKGKGTVGENAADEGGLIFELVQNQAYDTMLEKSWDYIHGTWSLFERSSSFDMHVQ